MKEMLKISQKLADTDLSCLFGLQYPELTAHWEKIRHVPAIEKYTKSDKRYPHVLGTNVIEDDRLLLERVEAKKAPVQNFQKRMAGAR